MSIGGVRLSIKLLFMWEGSVVCHIEKVSSTEFLNVFTLFWTFWLHVYLTDVILN